MTSHYNYGRTNFPIDLKFSTYLEIDNLFDEFVKQLIRSSRFKIYFYFGYPLAYTISNKMVLKSLQTNSVQTKKTTTTNKERISRYLCKANHLEAVDGVVETFSMLR